jgi:hypothetical protein
VAALKHRSFTVRLPHDLYLELAAAADGDGECLNVTVNKLLKLGLGKHLDLTKALHRLLQRTVLEGGLD